MGYIRHNAIVVTSWDEYLLSEAHKKAAEIFNQVAPITPITPKGRNGYASFLVAPDGSKEGWELSEVGNVCRERFVTWLDSQRDEDGSTPLQWLETQFGDSQGAEAKVVRCSS